VSNRVRYRHVPGFTAYRVGTDGSVWTRFRVIRTGEHNGTWTADKKGEWRLRRPTLSKDGYLYVSIIRDRDRKMFTRKVHQLVLWAFVGPQEAGVHSRHKNGIKTDCRLDNLCYGSAKDNADDKRRQGTLLRGGASGFNTKIPLSEVLRIRAHRPSPAEVLEIAKKYGMGRVQIYNIIARRSWKHVA
jgi:hypothetical protein